VTARLHDRFEILALAASFRHLPHQQLRKREDRHQRVVEVMRYAAGECAERFELLRMKQLTLELALSLLGRPRLGHIPDRPDAPDGTVFMIECQFEFDADPFKRPVRTVNAEL